MSEKIIIHTANRPGMVWRCLRPEGHDGPCALEALELKERPAWDSMSSEIIRLQGLLEARRSQTRKDYAQRVADIAVLGQLLQEGAISGRTASRRFAVVVILALIVLAICVAIALLVARDVALR